MENKLIDNQKKLRFATNGKRDIHGVEEEFDKSFEKLDTIEKWKYEENRKCIIRYI